MLAFFKISSCFFFICCFFFLLVGEGSGETYTEKCCHEEMSPKGRCYFVVVAQGALALVLALVQWTNQYFLFLTVLQAAR